MQTLDECEEKFKHGTYQGYILVLLKQYFELKKVSSSNCSTNTFSVFLVGRETAVPGKLKLSKSSRKLKFISSGKMLQEKLKMNGLFLQIYTVVNLLLVIAKISL